VQIFDQLNGPYSTNKRIHLGQKGHVEIDLSKIQRNIIFNACPNWVFILLNLLVKKTRNSTNDPTT
jgi:hypothetical protein